MVIDGGIHHLERLTGYRSNVPARRLCPVPAQFLHVRGAFRLVDVHLVRRGPDLCGIHQAECRSDFFAKRALG
jgi:hypothetical protein